MKRLLHFSGLAAVLLALLAFDWQAGVAQSGPQWAAVQRIPGYADNTFAPVLVADHNRTVHAFNSQLVDTDVAVIYSQWTAERGWTEPVDIVLSPRNQQALVSGAYLDKAGIMHLVFFGGNEQGADMYYSAAPAANAGQASAWSQPIAVGQSAGPISAATLVGDDRNHLFLLYAGTRDGTGLYEVHSIDSGATWSEPVALFFTYDTTLMPSDVGAFLDDQGRLHAVWSVVNQAAHGEGVYYARLEADHKTWSTPFLLAASSGYGANHPSIIQYQNTLFVIYQNGRPNDGLPTRWMRQSADGGQTWTDPMRPFAFIGQYGRAAMVIDSSNTLHMILGNRWPDPETHGMWHSTWDGKRWTDLTPITSGPKTPQYDPSGPKAVVSQGNVILATWHNDSAFNGVWWSFIRLDTPELPVLPLPQPLKPTPVITAAPTATATAAPAASVGQNYGDGSAPAIADRGLTMTLATVPVVLLIGIVFLVSYAARLKQR